MVVGMVMPSAAAYGAQAYWKGASKNTPFQTPTDYRQNSWWAAGWSTDPTDNDVYLQPDYLDSNIGLPQTIHLGTFYKTYIDGTLNILKPGGIETINSLNVRGFGWTLSFAGRSPQGLPAGEAQNGGLTVAQDAIVGAKSPGSLRIIGEGGIESYADSDRDGWGDGGEVAGYTSMHVLGKLLVGQAPVSSPSLISAQPVSSLAVGGTTSVAVLGPMSIGNLSSGTLEVYGGSTLGSAGSVTLGASPLITGTARIGHDAATGPNSVLYSYGATIVGEQGTGTLDVGRYGQAFSGGVLAAGIGAQSRGTISAVGPGAWIDSHTLVIGGQGQGTLTVANGGAVTTSHGPLVVGAFGSGTGKVTVKGNDSYVYANGPVRIMNGSVELASNGALYTNEHVEIRERGRLAGHGAVVGHVFNAGEIAASTYGSALTNAPSGTMTVFGHYMQPTGKLTVDLQTRYPAPWSGVLDITGAAMLGGDLQVSFQKTLAYHEPLTGMSYTLVRAAEGLQGAFDAVRLPKFANGMWALEYTDHVVNLRFLVPGDYNHDLVVDAADLGIWNSMYGQKGLGLVADGNWDGVVDEKDLELVKKYFGQVADVRGALPSPFMASFSAGSVPEPTSMGMACMALAAFLAPIRARLQQR